MTAEVVTLGVRIVIIIAPMLIINAMQFYYNKTKSNHRTKVYD